MLQVPGLEDDQLRHHLWCECAGLPGDQQDPHLGADHHLGHHVPCREVLLLPQHGAAGLGDDQGEAQGGGPPRASGQQGEGFLCCLLVDDCYL